MNFRPCVLWRFASRAGLALLAAATLLTLFLVTTSASSPTRELALPANPSDFVPDRVLVKFREGVSPVMPGKPSTGQTQLDRALAESGVERATPLFPTVTQPGDRQSGLALDSVGLSRIYRLQLRAGQSVSQTVAALSGNPDVEYAEPDYIARPAAYPDDPRYGDQWGLGKIQVEGAWNVVTGTPTVAIAIVDSGVDLTHPDLAPNLWVNPGEIPGNGIDDDANGFVDDINGWNFVAGSNDVADDSGHGTLVAGVAAARTDNGIGIAGVCGNCRFMPVKVMQPSGIANYSDIAAGVVYATAKGARVINLSLGGYADSKTLRDAITNAVAQNIVVVGGAGNDGVSTPFYPAAYEDVIAVAGTTAADTRTGASNYGSWVDVCAPGEGILTTALGGDYLATSGTSIAAPLASGLAGLLLAVHPDWTPALVRSQLMHTADPIDTLNPGYGGQLGSGRINATRAVQPSQPVLTYAGYTVNGTPNGRPDFGAGAALGVFVHDDWADALGVTGSLTTADPYVTVVTGTATFGDVLSGKTIANGVPFSITIAAGAGYNHDIPFQLSLSGNSGAYATTLPFTVTTRSSIEKVAGTLPGDALWTSDKTYLVTNNLNVPVGVTLTIQAGTVVKINGAYAFNVRGTLIADGTADRPIVFSPNVVGSTWNRIFFDDSSQDAVVTQDGTYQRGTLLRYVQIKGASGGLQCNNATPYFSRLTTDGGGISCTLGAGQFWLLDSTVGGSVYASGTGHMARTTVYGGALGLGVNSEVLTSTVGGHITLGDGSIVAASSVGGGVTISGNGTVESSTARGTVSLSNGSVVSSTVTGANISLTSGSVLSSTVRYGGIVVGANSTVFGNNVEDSPSTAIQAGTSASIVGNRAVRSGGAGVMGTSGLIQGNLVASTSGDGLQAGPATVISNTLIDIRGRALYLSGGIPVKIAGNNFEFNTGQYDLYNDNAGGPTSEVIAQHNWWGRTDVTDIKQRIYDYDVDDTKGRVSFTPALSGPVENAPAYVRAVTLNPASPVGIQSVAIDVQFSRAMDHNSAAQTSFRTTRSGSWDIYNKGNSGLCGDHIRDMTTDTQGFVWFSTYDAGLCSLSPEGVWTRYGYSGEGVASDGAGGVWLASSSGAVHLDASRRATVYNASNSPLPGSGLVSASVDSHDNVWFATRSGAYRLAPDGTWASFNTSNSGLGTDFLWTVYVDRVERVWFNPNCEADCPGVSMLAPDGTWSIYNTSNSGLADNNYCGYALMDLSGNMWFTCVSGGISKLSASGLWSTYRTGTGGLLGGARDLALDYEGNVWVGTQGAAYMITPDGTWTIYKPGNPGLSFVEGVAVTRLGDIWFGSYFGGAVSVLHRGVGYTVADGAAWASDSQYHASFDFNTLVPRGAYSLTVSAARGLDGIEIAPFSGITFTVDYAGSITDKTPPHRPSVLAWGNGTLTALSARWSATDPESAITLYRYAIGTTPGGTDVVNWTNTPATSTTRAGLNLLPGQPYYVSVKARNEGGLWSEPGVSNGVIAGTELRSTYLPLVLKGE